MTAPIFTQPKPSIDEQIVAVMRLADETREQAEYHANEVAKLVKRAEMLGTIVAALLRLKEQDVV